MGVGFDAEIADQANRGRGKTFLNRLGFGSLNYIIALLQVLFRFSPISIDLVLDGKTYIIENCWMVTIANHPYYGGGMKVIPDASIKPDTFRVLVLQSISKWKVLALFMSIFAGKHIKFKEVSLLEAV